MEWYWKEKPIPPECEQPRRHEYDPEPNSPELSRMLSALGTVFIAPTADLVRILGYISNNDISLEIN